MYKVHPKYQFYTEVSVSSKQVCKSHYKFVIGQCPKCPNFCSLSQIQIDHLSKHENINFYPVEVNYLKCQVYSKCFTKPPLINSLNA